jgi:hypothetical protein
VRVGDKFGIFSAAFKMTVPGSRSWPRNGTKPASDDQIIASGLVRDTESPGDLQKSGRLTQLDGA